MCHRAAPHLVRSAVIFLFIHVTVSFSEFMMLLNWANGPVQSLDREMSSLHTSVYEF